MDKKFPILISLVLKELTSSGHLEKDPPLKTLEKAADKEEIYSVLRDRVFRTDAKTKEFFEYIDKQLVEQKLMPRTEVSESQFADIMLESFKKSLAAKNSDYKLEIHYFSPEKDLNIRISDKYGFETQFRILVIKTS